MFTFDSFFFNNVKLISFCKIKYITLNIIIKKSDEKNRRTEISNQKTSNIILRRKVLFKNK